jgi:hypothetical protein
LQRSCGRCRRERLSRTRRPQEPIGRQQHKEQQKTDEEPSPIGPMEQIYDPLVRIHKLPPFEK